MEYPINSIWSNVSCKTCVSLTVFCLNGLSIDVSSTLKPPTIIESLSISPFMAAQFSSAQSFSHSRLFATPWTAECQPPLSIFNSRSLLKLMSIKSVMPSKHFIICHPLLLLPAIFPSIRFWLVGWLVGCFFSPHESIIRIRWPKKWSFNFSISPSNECSGLISVRMDWLDLLAVQGTLKSLRQYHSSKTSILLLSCIHDYWKNHSFDETDLCWQCLCFLICCLSWS